LLKKCCLNILKLESVYAANDFQTLALFSYLISRSRSRDMRVFTAFPSRGLEADGHSRSNSPLLVEMDGGKALANAPASGGIE
jgi:hypothetical protein